MEAAPGVFGLEGPAAVRLVTGAGSGARLSAGDAALKGEDPGKAALLGAGGGALGPVLEGGAYAAGKVAGAADKLAGSISDLAASFTSSRQKATAATTVRNAMSDPATTLPALAKDGTLVPGSPTWPHRSRPA